MLAALLRPLHGSVDNNAAVVLRLVTPALLGVSKLTGGGTADGVKTTATAPSQEAVAASTRARRFVASILR